jgi:hypothetical protein
MALLVITSIAACSAAPAETPTPTLTGDSPTPAATPSGSAGTAAPGATGATPSDAVGTGEPNPDGSIATPEPLPEPSLTEPADIAAALFDPTRVAVGVVSLIDVMGVAVYDSEGALVRAGADRGAGEMTLTENEVRHLIRMTEEDLPQQTDAGGPFPIADMYGALQPSLPADFSLDDFVTAYADAYSAEPDSLAAQVMRGQTIDAQAGLLRIQMWLLLIDGFVGGPESVGAALSAVGRGAGSVAVLPAGATLGAARQNLPTLTSPTPGITSPAWAFLLSRLPTLAETIPFNVVGPTNIHEGHGGPGSQITFEASVGVAQPFLHPSGVTILAAAPRPGLTIRWTSPDEAIWAQHGTFGESLDQPISISPGLGQIAGLNYTPRAEHANGVGTLLDEGASLYAEADAIDLINHSYDVGWVGAAISLARGTVVAGAGDGFHTFEWHEEGNGYYVRIEWTDIYDGIPDNVTFLGIVDDLESGTPGAGDAQYSGGGIAFGSRPGIVHCNQALGDVPSGQGKADFIAGVTGDEVTIIAFAYEPLAGVSTVPFLLPIEGGQRRIGRMDFNPGEVCPHGFRGIIEATPIGTP